MTLYRHNWYRFDDDDAAVCDLSGIYEWRLGNESLYIGKAKRLKRRTREYSNNIRKLIHGEPYRKGKPASYRPVHHELRSAHDRELTVIVTVLEYCDKADLNDRERYWIERRRQEAEAGGPRVLNATT